jgi:hypothetical protein
MSGGRCWGRWARSLPEDFGAGAATLCLERGGICRNAGACASAVERAEKGNAGKVNASAEAARVARDAPKTEARGQRATIAGVSSLARWTAKVLAAEILRLQCVQRAEDQGEAGLHPHEPGEEEVGDAPQGLAVEQLGVLCKRRTGSG